MIDDEKALSLIGQIHSMSSDWLMLCFSIYRPVPTAERAHEEKDEDSFDQSAVLSAAS